MAYEDPMMSSFLNSLEKDFSSQRKNESVRIKPNYDTISEITLKTTGLVRNFMLAVIGDEQGKIADFEQQLQSKDPGEIKQFCKEILMITEIMQDPVYEFIREKFDKLGSANFTRLQCLACFENKLEEEMADYPCVGQLNKIQNVNINIQTNYGCTVLICRECRKKLDEFNRASFQHTEESNILNDLERKKRSLYDLRSCPQCRGILFADSEEKESFLSEWEEAKEEYEKIFAKKEEEKEKKIKEQVQFIQLDYYATGFYNLGIVRHNHERIKKLFAIAGKDSIKYIKPDNATKKQLHVEFESRSRSMLGKLISAILTTKMTLLINRDKLQMFDKWLRCNGIDPTVFDFKTTRWISGLLMNVRYMSKIFYPPQLFKFQSIHNSVIIWPDYLESCEIALSAYKHEGTFQYLVNNDRNITFNNMDEFVALDFSLLPIIPNGIFKISDEEKEKENGQTKEKIKTKPNKDIIEFLTKHNHSIKQLTPFGDPYLVSLLTSYIATKLYTDTSTSQKIKKQRYTQLHLDMVADKVEKNLIIRNSARLALEVVSGVESTIFEEALNEKELKSKSPIALFVYDKLVIDNMLKLDQVIDKVWTKMGKKKTNFDKGMRFLEESSASNIIQQIPVHNETKVWRGGSGEVSSHGSLIALLACVIASVILSK